MAEWEPKETTVKLEQVADPPKLSQSGNVCGECGAKENLWLNLSDGKVFCGQTQADGSGGKGHARKHYEDSGKKHPLVVKLGSLTATTADVMSYSEGDVVTDGKLSEHLAHFGIHRAACAKTEKSLREMEMSK